MRCRCRYWSRDAFFDFIAICFQRVKFVISGICFEEAFMMPDASFTLPGRYGGFSHFLSMITMIYFISLPIRLRFLYVSSHRLSSHSATGIFTVATAFRRDIPHHRPKATTQSAHAHGYSVIASDFRQAWWCWHSRLFRPVIPRYFAGIKARLIYRHYSPLISPSAAEYHRHSFIFLMRRMPTCCWELIHAI